MAVNIPFPLPATGYALNSKVRVNLDFLVAQFNEFNSGTATWDTVAIGTANNLTGVLTFYNSSNVNYLSIRPGATSGNITYTLPATNPSVTTSLLKVDTSGVMSWSDVSFDITGADNGLLWISGGVSIDSLVNSQGTTAILIGSTGNTPKWVKLLGTTNQISVTYNTNDVTLTTPQNIDTAADFQVNSIKTAAGTNLLCAVRLNANNTGFYMPSASEMDFVIGGTSYAALDTSGNFFATTGEIRGNDLRALRHLKITGTGGSIVTIDARSSFTSYSLVLPTDDGNSGEILSTDGSGNLSWTSTSAAGAATKALDNLASVAINTSLLAGTDNSIDLGSTAKNWRSVYLSTSIKNGATTLATATELGYLTGVTSAIQTQFSGKASTALDNLSSVAVNSSLLPGTDNSIDLGSSSKRWVNLFVKDGDFGASGTPGSVDVFPSTALKGKLSFTAADNSGNTTTTIVNASQAGARTYTIVDAGASANFVMSEGDATVNGAKTFGSAITISPTTNQLVLGATRTVTFTAPTPASTSRVVTFPDLSADYSVVGTAGTQTIGGAKTFSSDTTFSGHIYAADGTTGAPSISFTSDTDTGFKWSSSGRIDVVGNNFITAFINAVGSSDDTEYTPLELRGGGGGNAGTTYFDTYSSTSVSTAKQIGTIHGDGVMFFVYGSNGSTKKFIEIVLALPGVTPPIVVSQATTGSPDARTYSVASTTQFKVAMAAGSYDIHTFEIGVTAR